jgi:hypothetical protein
MWCYLEMLVVDSVTTVSIIHVVSGYSGHTIAAFCECSTSSCGLPVDDVLADLILNLHFLLKPVFTDPPASIASSPGETRTGILKLLV